ncbi:MAG: hypothetical protein LBQ10_07280 [Desulfovibrio sp.]|jgi:hypothetical protein|nr:hypothetical protein [Desulfovibrio sp.]
MAVERLKEGNMLPDSHCASRRGVEWAKFAVLVLQHIEEYTVPQYGDAPDDQASGFSEHDIAVNMRRYVNRLESNSRGPEEARRDLLKIAHYCAMLYFKRQRG